MRAGRWPASYQITRHSWVALAFAASCSSATQSAPNAAAKPVPAVYTLEVAATPDSAVKLAKFAMGAIDGTLSLPRVRPAVTTVSTHYVRNRRGGGQTEVAVMAAVHRQIADSARPVTLVELSAWALDSQQQQTVAQRRSGMPATPLSQNAPALKTPRAITVADTTDWRALNDVLDAFVQGGARIKP